MKKCLFVLFAVIMLTAGCEKKGLEGKTSLIDLIVESAGENCSTGGFKVVSGIDLNGNDLLDEAEIQTTKYICNGGDGSDGLDGLNSLVDVLDEAPGENCSAGGYKVISGIDINRNQLLDETEIQNTEYACNGVDGGFDKQIIINFPDGSLHDDTSYTFSPKTGRLLDFDITNYSNIDSIAFDANCFVRYSKGTATIELYDLTNDTPIANTMISFGESKMTRKTTSKNFMNDLPNAPITLVIRGKINSLDAAFGAVIKPRLVIYRKD